MRPLAAGILIFMLKGTALGLIVGFAAGWIAFGADGSAPSAAVDRSPSANAELPGGGVRAPALVASPTAHPERSEPSRTDVEEPRSKDLATRTASELHTLCNAMMADQRLSAEEGAILIARARDARERGDAELFCAAIRGISKSEGEAADRFLLETLADVALPLPSGAHGIYWGQGLSDASIPGVSAAARARLETTAPHHDAWLLTLVAIHADADDVDWLTGLAKDEEEYDAHRVMEALARGAGNPLVLSAFARLLDERPESADEHWSDLLRAAPAAAGALLTRHLRGAEVRGDAARVRTLLRTQAGIGLREDMEPVQQAIANAMTPDETFDALTLAEALRRRDVEVPETEELVRATLALVRHADERVREKALRALEGARRLAWTAEVLDTLESAAPDASWLPELRAHLASPWKRNR
jgi:hypothetical protein